MDDGILLSTAEMARADALAVESGVTIDALMAAAGRAVATVVAARFPRGEILVLCGPGNNGGDGFAAATELAARGRRVRVATLGPRAAMRGAAARAAALWCGPIEDARPDCLDGAAVAVDALFGAGLNRDLDGAARALVEVLAASRLPVVAVDIPSGIDGDSGAVRGAAAAAMASVTFFRRKPGHLLLPGRAYCGSVLVAQIGIPDSVLGSIAARCQENRPVAWREALPRPGLADHKFRRGHVLVVGGGALTGAARLAARAALRAGAGLVTLAVPDAALAIYRAACDPALMVERCDEQGGLARNLADPRRNAVLLGPGGGADSRLCGIAIEALESGRAVVLDADALTAFAAAPARLFASIRGPTVLTPHEGEFARLFPGLQGSKLARARAAASVSGAVILLKGADTVVAHPDGRAMIQDDAPPDLATAGSGDVLGGIVAGLLAQGMPAFLAAAAGVWLHGTAARIVGAGLIASDIPEAVPGALRRLRGGLNPVRPSRGD